MLKITDIQIGHTKQGCITDERPNIRFSLESDVPGEMLKKAAIRCGNWEMETTDQLNNVYGGPWEPFQSYTIEILAVGITGETACSKASFSTGRLSTPWTAKWITDNSYVLADKQSPVPLVFEKNFTVDKPVKKAWINVTALGIYEMELNGEKVGSDYFAPGFTSYAHQIQYQTYDFLPMLQAENRIRFTVAGGWAVGPFSSKRNTKISADRQALLAEIHLEYKDGSKEIVATDPSWKVTAQSPYSLAEWYDGECYDGEFIQEHAVWHPADVTAPRGEPKLLAQYGESVRVGTVLHPIQVTQSESGEYIYDFGQNIAGVVRAKMDGAHSGQIIIFRHSEVLMDGELFVKSLRTAKATLTYRCRGGEQEYTPRFTYMGFRYVGVKGITPDHLELTAMTIHSTLESVGQFHCSNPLLNRLQENIRRGGLSNFVDIPTDCPQRDERMGWTGDAAVFASTACYNFDMSRFYDKWLRDMSSEQGRGGGLPYVVPRQSSEWPVAATSCWGDSCIMVPWAEYLSRGDIALLERQYPTMQRFMKAVRGWARMFSVGDHRYIWQIPFHFGDWCAPGGEFRQWISKGKWVATAYFANSCNLMVKISKLLKKEKEAAYYEKLRSKIVRAYRNIFTDGEGRLKEEFQTAYVLPLHFAMTQGEETTAMANNLATILRENDYKVGTGFPGTPYLLFALSDNGHLEDAYRVLLQEDCPGWLYAVQAGATTMWERWDALKPDGTVNMGENGEENGGMVSFNHYANGAVGDWMYRRLLGIEPTAGGYRTFNVCPMLGGGITEASGTVKTPYGEISVEWHMDGSKFHISVQVPVSTECRLTLPNGKQHILTSGSHLLTCEE